MKYTITHRTLYRYSSGVALCHNEARLLPRETPWQFCQPSRIEIRPRPVSYTHLTLPTNREV